MPNERATTHSRLTHCNLPCARSRANISLRVSTCATCAIMLAATQANAALVLFEGFETGLGAWTPQSYIHPDAIGLFDPTFTRTTERAESGNWSLNASANGFNADGTFWLEQPVNLPAGTWNIVLSFQLWSPTQSEINNWEVVASVGTINPEVEEDLIELGETNRDGTWIYYELDRTIAAKQRPIVVITSNNEKELPDAFLRRCFFHFIRFPNRETMQQIVDVHYPELDKVLLERAMKAFFAVREVKALKKKPSTSELIDWIKLLLWAKVSADDLKDLETMTDLPPFLGSLLKNEQDHDLYTALRARGIR